MVSKITNVQHSCKLASHKEAPKSMSYFKPIDYSTETLSFNYKNASKIDRDYTNLHNKIAKQLYLNS